MGDEAVKTWEVMVVATRSQPVVYWASIKAASKSAAEDEAMRFSREQLADGREPRVLSEGTQRVFVQEANATEVTSGL